MEAQLAELVKIGLNFGVSPRKAVGCAPRGLAPSTPGAPFGNSIAALAALSFLLQKNT